jgi:microcystin-dependent protein
MFGGNFAPAGWAFCNGALMPISENDALFTLIGTTYGGDGQETFALPDLQGRLPLHQGQGPGLSNYVIGQTGGVESVTLTTNQIPNHNHGFIASSATASSTAALNQTLAQPTTIDLYRPSTSPATPPNATLNAVSVGPAGGSQPHDNMQPFLCISFIISLFGIFPTQS